jgi:hypothetical protein
MEDAMLLVDVAERLKPLPPGERSERERLIEALADAALELPLSDLAPLRASLEELSVAESGATSRAALTAARARNITRVLEDFARLESESVPGTAVLSGLGVSRQRLHQLRQQGRLVAVRSRARRASRYPAWQFTDRGEIVAGLERVLRAAQEAEMGPETLHFFMTEPSDRLGGNAPGDLLARGEVDRIVEVLRSIGFNGNEEIMRSEDTETAKSMLPRIVLPPLDPPSPEELAHRREIFARSRALRDEIGPIGIRSDELLREAREDADAANE